MRYFTLDDAGDIHYLEQAEIDALDKTRSSTARPQARLAVADVLARRSRTSRSSTARSARPQIRVHRHIGWNLGDDYLKKHPQLIRHLETEGQGHDAGEGRELPAVARRLLD